MEEKTLFFGCEVHAPWPEQYPKGRILEEKDRHLSLAFLGKNPINTIEQILKDLPLPLFKIGLIGKFDHIVFLPPHHPHVVAWHVAFTSNLLLPYQKELHKYLISHQIPVKSHKEFLPHVTISRSPFDRAGWKNSFAPLPLFIGALHLYESLGSSKYASLWSYPITPPFVEIDHTADIGYLIYGSCLTELFEHAQTALCFSFPPLLSYLIKQNVDSLEEIVMYLNEMVAKADQDIGCPFKAVSFHGKILEKDKLLQWEMIIDV